MVELLVPVKAKPLEAHCCEKTEKRYKTLRSKEKQREATNAPKNQMVHESEFQRLIEVERQQS